MSGDKSALVQRITDKAVGKTKEDDQILLEETIMTWSMQDLKDYLQTTKKPSWGSKKNLTESIISNIAIDDAVEITHEYRTYLAATTEITEEGTIPEDRMDIDDEEKEETEEKNVVRRKQFTPRRSKVVHEADKVMVTMVSPVEDNSNPIPKGKGRVGSDDGADETGWKNLGWR